MEGWGVRQGVCYPLCCPSLACLCYACCVSANAFAFVFCVSCLQAGAKIHPTLAPADIILGIKETPLEEILTSPAPSSPSSSYYSSRSLFQSSRPSICSNSTPTSRPPSSTRVPTAVPVSVFGVIVSQRLTSREYSPLAS